MYLLDANAIIHYFKCKGNVVSCFLKTSPTSLFVPVIVLYELEVGIKNSNNPQKREKEIYSLIENFEKIPFGLQEAKEAAKIKTQLMEKGEMIGPLDILIAGTAIANRKILVTHNTKEFQRINGLQIEDWYL